MAVTKLRSSAAPLGPDGVAVPSAPAKPLRLAQRPTIGLVQRFWPAEFRYLSRPRRILLALAAIWLLNAFDLVFTVTETSRIYFIEMNPVAAWLLRQPIYVLVAYKAILVGVGSALLISQRRHRLAELASWFLLAAYAWVGVRWSIYYVNLLEIMYDPAINVNPITGGLLPY